MTVSVLRCRVVDSSRWWLSRLGTINYIAESFPGAVMRNQLYSSLVPRSNTLLSLLYHRHLTPVKFCCWCHWAQWLMFSLHTSFTGWTYSFCTIYCDQAIILSRAHLWPSVPRFGRSCLSGSRFWSGGKYEKVFSLRRVQPTRCVRQRALERLAVYFWHHSKETFRDLKIASYSEK